MRKIMPQVNLSNHRRDIHFGELCQSNVSIITPSIWFSRAGGACTSTSPEKFWPGARTSLPASRGVSSKCYGGTRVRCRSFSSRASDTPASAALSPPSGTGFTPLTKPPTTCRYCIISVCEGGVAWRVALMVFKCSRNVLGGLLQMVRNWNLWICPPSQVIMIRQVIVNEISWIEIRIKNDFFFL